MKIIEAMKRVKQLKEKADDLRNKIAACSADYDFETPAYPDQREQVRQWLQAHSDVVKEILHLTVSIQRTNLSTNVTIDLGGKSITKTIAEWIHRRGMGKGMFGLAKLELEAWSKLTDKNLKEGTVKQSSGELREVKLRRYYEPKERDKMLDLYRTEPHIIDSTLEVVNAVTDLIE